MLGIEKRFVDFPARSLIHYRDWDIPVHFSTLQHQSKISKTLGPGTSVSTDFLSTQHQRPSTLNSLPPIKKTPWP
jgi:hypothetical protein